MHGMIGLIRDRKDMLRQQRQQQLDKYKKNNDIIVASTISEPPSHQYQPPTMMLLPPFAPQLITPFEPLVPSANNSKYHRPAW